MTQFVCGCVCRWGGMWVEVGGDVVSEIYLQLARLSLLSAKVSLFLSLHTNASTPASHTHTDTHRHTHTQTQTDSHTQLSQTEISVCVCVRLYVCATVWKASAACLAALHAPAVHRLQHEEEKASSPLQCLTLMNCHILWRDSLIPQTLSDKHVLLKGSIF